MKKPVRLIVVLVLLAVMAAGGRYYFLHRNGQAGDNLLHLYGNVDMRQVQLNFQASGRLLAIHVREGDRVRRGQLLAEIDPVRYRIRLRQLLDELAAREQELHRLEAGTRPEEIARARALVAASEARLRDTTLTYNRLARLVRVKVGSQQAVDNARAAMEVALHSLEADKKALELAVAGPRREDIEAARARVRAGRAAVDLAREELADTRLSAPADGILRNRILEPGDMVSPALPVLTLALTDPLWVRAYCPEIMLGRIAPGMAAEVRTDSRPGRVYRGWLGYISPVAEFTPKNVETPELRTRLVYQVRVFVCDPRGELRLGMPATVSIDLDRAANPPGRDQQSVCRKE